ncbi:MAG TPA: hypothetical protein VJH23_06485 [archaeon]|nr:hypothetical protein [archaeon]
MAPRRGIIQGLLFRGMRGGGVQVPRGMQHGGAQPHHGMQHGGVQVPHGMQNINEISARMKSMIEHMPGEMRQHYSNPHNYKQNPGTAPMRDRAQMAHIGEEIKEMQKLMNSRPMNVHSQQEIMLINEHRMRLLQALAQGEISSLQGYQRIVMMELMQMGSPPQIAQIEAKKVVEALRRTFSPQAKTAIEKHFKNFEIIARGGDPHD